MQNSKLIKLLIISTIVFFLTTSLFILLPPASALADIVINEFSSSTTDDWIELYNTGTQSAQLSNFRIRDSTTNKKDLTGELNSESFIVVDFSNRLNNDGDIVKLMKLEGETEILLEEIPYGTVGGLCPPESDGSIGRFPDGGAKIIRFTSQTKGSSNNSGQENPCVTSIPNPTDTSVPTPKPTNKPTSFPTSKSQSTSTGKILPTSTKIPTKILTKESTITDGLEISNNLGNEKILGETIDKKTTISGENRNSQMTRRIHLIRVILLIFGGLGLIVGAIISSVRQINNQKRTG